MIRVVASTEHLAVPTEKFLQEVQRRPCLWDPTHTMFHNPNAKRLAFRLIAGTLIPNVTESRKDEIGALLGKKWKGIRDHYVNVIMSEPTILQKYSNNRYIQLLGFLDSTLPHSALERVEAIDSDSRETSSCSHAGTSQTIQSVSSANKTSNNSTCAPKKETESPPNTKDVGQSRSTMMIDGVEFEQVTLANGEVIVKLKEEVLEDPPAPKRMATFKKETPNTLVEKKLQPQGKRDKQRFVHKEQSGHRVQQQSSHRHIVSDSLLSHHNTELKKQYCKQERRQPTKNELKITSTTTLAASASKLLPDGQLKIIGSTFNQKLSQGVTQKVDENLSPNIVSFPKIGKMTTEQKLTTIQNPSQKDMYCIDDVLKSVPTSSNLVFQKLSDVLKPENPLTEIQKEAIARKLDSVVISDEEKASNSSPLDATGDRQDNPKTTTDFLDRWNAELKRLAAIPSKRFQQHAYIPNDLQRHASVTAVVSETFSGDAQHNSNSISPSRRVKTNRNTALLLKPIGPASADVQNHLPNLTPTKTVKTNRNTVVLNNWSDSDGEDEQDEPSSSPPAKKLKATSSKQNHHQVVRSNNTSPKDVLNPSPPLTPGILANRNAIAITDESSCSRSSDAQETPALPQVKSVASNLEKVAGEEPELVPKPSKPIEIPDEDEEPISKNDGTADSLDADEDKKFLLSLLPEMKKMTEGQNYEFRLDIMQALTRSKYL